MKRKVNAWSLILLVILSLSACQRNVSNPASSPTNPPIIVVEPTSTPAPTPTPTYPPTPTPIPGARIESGDEALFLGDWEKALLEYQSAQENSQDPEIQSAALLGIGRARLMAGNHYEAVITLEKLIEQHPDSPQIAYAHFFLAQSHQAEERYWEAADAYLNYLAVRPGLIDAYILKLRADALMEARDYAGATLDYQAAVTSPSMLDDLSLKLDLARSLALSGDYATALVLYNDLYYRTNNEHIRALIDLRKGGAYQALGQTDLAIAAYQDAVDSYPTSYNSYLSLVELVNAGVEVDELQRGIIDYHAGEYGVALGAFDRYLQNNPADPGSAYYYYGLTTRALGGWKDAIGWWDQLIQEDSDHLYWDDAWEQKAYTQWALLEQYPEATQTLVDFVDKAPGHPRAAEFLFDAGLVAERDLNLEQAAELWERLVKTYPDFLNSPRAMFLTGLSYYRLGKYQEALGAFQRFLSLVDSLEERAAAYLWMGKSQQALGDPQAAQSSWETAAGIDPTGYYSERARDILHNRPPFAHPLGYDIMADERAERAIAETWLRNTFGLPDDTDLSGLGRLASEPGLQRGAELWELGLYDDAREEFEALRQSVALDAADSYRLGNYLVDLGVYRTAIIAARQTLDLALMDDATTLSAPEHFSHIRFGTYFKDQIMPLAQEYGFHPLFLFSLVRQESLFDAFVSSSADARGLMQIIPPTGEEIYGNLGWPPGYSVDDLFRPVVNLKFGIDYLDTQRNKFDGDLYAALAAYNGGPGNAEIWYHMAPDDPDLFLEVVRFIETRNYIRGIYELFNIYRLIYDRTP